MTSFSREQITVSHWKNWDILSVNSFTLSYFPLSNYLCFYHCSKSSLIIRSDICKVTVCSSRQHLVNISVLNLDFSVIDLEHLLVPLTWSKARDGLALIKISKEPSVHILISFENDNLQVEWNVQMSLIFLFTLRKLHLIIIRKLFLINIGW